MGSAFLISGAGTNGTDERTFVKEFVLSDFSRVGLSDKYVMRIPDDEHRLASPYVDAVIANIKSETEEGSVTETAKILIGDSISSTGTVLIYVTLPLNKYTEFTGKIILKGD